MFEIFQFWKHRMRKLMQFSACFTISWLNLLVLLLSLLNTQAQGTKNYSTCWSVLLLHNNVHWLEFRERHNTPGCFSSNFHCSLIIWSWKLIKCFLKTLFKGCKHHIIVHKKWTVDPGAHVTLALTVYQIYIEYEEERGQHTPFSVWNTCGWLKWTQLSENEYTGLMLIACVHQHYTFANITKIFLNGLDCVLLQCRQLLYPWCALKISQKFSAE